MVLCERPLIAVDIGNSRMKLGSFARAAEVPAALPEPSETLDLSVVHATGAFDVSRLGTWCQQHAVDGAEWRVASVHRAAAERLAAAVGNMAAQFRRAWAVRQLTYRDVPLAMLVETPERVGIDRLMAAVAADRLRTPERAAVVVDAGTAITVDLVDTNGAFRGGAILPGIAMSAGALEALTDALPRVAMQRIARPPAVLGKSTVAAIESGLYWGTVGAIRELVRRLSESFDGPPDVLLTGGASTVVAEILSASEPWWVRHVPHLVLSGIAVVNG